MQRTLPQMTDQPDTEKSLNAVHQQFWRTPWVTPKTQKPRWVTIPARSLWSADVTTPISEVDEAYFSEATGRAANPALRWDK